MFFKIFTAVVQMSLNNFINVNTVTIPGPYNLSFCKATCLTVNGFIMALYILFQLATRHV